MRVDSSDQTHKTTRYTGATDRGSFLIPRLKKPGQVVTTPHENSKDIIDNLSTQQQFNIAMNSAILPTTDSADEAGGEDIYCSDGLPPLQAPKAPILAFKHRQGGDDILDSEDLIDPSVERFLFSNESPLEKLTRLQHEVASLDFSSNHANSEELNSLVADLQAKLEAMTKLSPQEDLARMVEQHLSEHVNASKGASDLQRAGVVYELYGGGVTTPTLLEERLMKVEHLMGGRSDGNKSLLQRLQEMEEKVQRVDPKLLEEISMKAKVIRYVKKDVHCKETSSFK